MRTLLVLSLCAACGGSKASAPAPVAAAPTPGTPTHAITVEGEDDAGSQLDLAVTAAKTAVAKPTAPDEDPVLLVAVESLTSVGYIHSGAKVAGTGPQAESDCITAVVEDLVSKQVATVIKEHSK